METIGVGLIGTGFMGKCHALAWTSVRAVFGDTPAIRRVALCEVEESLARKRADEFGFEAATADWKALIANPQVDVVSITAPNAWHAPMAVAALEAGKHVGAKSRWRRRWRKPSAWRRRRGRAAGSPFSATTTSRVRQSATSAD